MDAIHQLEIILILWIQNLGAWLKEPMLGISILGSENFYMLVMPILYWSLDAALGLRLGMILLLSNGLNMALKLAFHTARPYWLSTGVKAYSVETSFGLPSGHAQNAASLWGLMATATRQKIDKILLVLVIFLIGFSRLYLGMHFISDVLAGWLVGGLLLWIFLKLERPVAAWLRARTLVQMLALALASAVALGLLILLPAAGLQNWQLPLAWQQSALSAQLSPITPLNLEDTFTITGTWFGLMAGVAWLYHLQGGFDTTGSPQQRLLRYLIGIVGILFFWYGLGSVFPRQADLLSYALRFSRYTLVGLWISALAPLLFQQFGLATHQNQVISSISSQKNPL